MSTDTRRAAKTAACQPKLGAGKSLENLPGRCRIGTACDGEATPKDLALRRLRIDGAVKPTLCCEACAEGLTA